jgi:hypothetical protein
LNKIFIIENILMGNKRLKIEYAVDWEKNRVGFFFLQLGRSAEGSE